MILTIVVSLITLSVLVLTHELGHFLVAKKAGIKVEEFGLGYPPRMVGKKIGETVYSLNWIPFGGFVRLYGEELEETIRKEAKGAFWMKSKKARAAVIVAGVFANFLLAIFVFSIVYSVSGIPTPTDKVKVVGIVPNSPAEEMGLKEGDIVLAVDDQPMKELKQFTRLIDEKKGKEIKITVAREEANPCLEKVLGGGGGGFSCQDNNLIFLITPRESPPQGEGPLGVVVSNFEIKKYAFWQMPFRGAVEGLKEAFGWTTLIISSLGKMVADLVMKGVVPREIAGPVGIFQITGTVAQSGILSILQFTGILSINLMIINILPFPALDGGKLVFIGYELVTRRRPRPSFEHWVNAAGMVVLLTLLSLVTINDIVRIVGTTDFLPRLRSVLP